MRPCVCCRCQGRAPENLQLRHSISAHPNLRPFQCRVGFSQPFHGYSGVYFALLFSWFASQRDPTKALASAYEIDAGLDTARHLGGVDQDSTTTGCPCSRFNPPRERHNQTETGTHMSWKRSHVISQRLFLGLTAATPWLCCLYGNSNVLWQLWLAAPTVTGEASTVFLFLLAGNVDIRVFPANIGIRNG